VKPGCGAAFDDLGETGQLSQLSVIAANDGYVYITVSSSAGATRFIARTDQVRAIADAIKEAAGR
jgi:hypothetical protein